MSSAVSQAMVKSPTESPLASLVRRASSRRVRLPQSQQTPTITFQYDNTPPREGDQYRSQPFPSPLLHGRFARDSTATPSSYERNSDLESASSNSTPIQFRSSNVYPDSELDYHYDNTYEESVYSQPDMTSAALRDSWNSTTTTSTAGLGRPTIDGRTSSTQATWADTRQQYHSQPSPSSLVPALVVFAPETTPRLAGRTAVVKPSSYNFSRPARPPLPVGGLEEQKRQVLLRNSNRQRSELPSATQRQPSSLRTQVGTSGGQPRPDIQGASMYTNSSVSSSFRQFSNQPPVMSKPSLGSTSLPPQGTLTPQFAEQPSRMTARVESSLSLYSNYSYYPYEGLLPSPTGSASPGSQRNPSSSSLALPNSNLNPSSPSPSSTSNNATKKQPPPKLQTAHDFLLLGIEHHEADRLQESALCFERSAVEGGGCGVGMLMWGLTLRHGWGCPKNEKLAFKWLQKAAESAVGDLEAKAKGSKDTSVVRTELVLAIYEVGQCFFQGWGVPKDQKMAFSYYTIAAKLGDPDAQMDLAFCLTNGKGCKKDKREAANWYRAAVKQGQSDVGLAWIYKDKYQ